MQNGSEEQVGDEAPLYIRWNPERVAYAVELRLDLVAEIANELARAEKLGTEVGGVLVGTLPSLYSPTLRIEDVEFVPRGAEEGAIYVLDPGQRDRLTEIRGRARARQREAVGFFRSHLRPGAMKPSLSDRSLLSGEFRDSVYAVLLIEGREPHSATFFLAANGRLSGEPSVRNFRFDESEFRALPEVPPEPAPVVATVSEESTSERKPRAIARAHGAMVYGTVAALLVIAAAACILMWRFSGEPDVARLVGISEPLKLSVENHGLLLGIRWNHGAREFDRASGATLAIVDGPSRRELPLGVDELRLGRVDYERSTGTVQVTLTVNGAEGGGAAGSWSQTAQWTQH